MGGESKKQTVGYKYYLGVHMVLCHGPIDFIYQVKADDRVAWTGYANGGQITINAPGLFGGEDKEGGVSGNVDILMGGPDQLQSSYLQSQLGDDIPAFRGVVSAVLKQCYMGMNPYLKRWSFRAQRIDVRSGNQEQWYKSKAAIGSFNNGALYIAMDGSGSMDNGPTANGESRWTNQRTAIQGALDFIESLFVFGIEIDIALNIYGTPTSTYDYTFRRACDSADISYLKSWIPVNCPNYNTDWSLGFVDVQSFFSGASSDKVQVIFFTTDGDPAATGRTQSEIIADSLAYLATVPDADVYCANIDLSDISQTELLDNTPGDGVPIIGGDDPDSLTAAIMRALATHLDMNPAHIIREALTDRLWGMGYLDSDINDDTFIAAANQLYDENMGMSILWDRQMPIEDFIKEIIRHINAVLYVQPSTGQLALKLMRDDYDENDLLTLNRSNIKKVSDYQRIDPSVSTNSVSVVYWDAKTGQNACVTADEVALIQAYGNVVGTTIQYPGFTNVYIAARAAERDLKMLAFPLLSVTIEANRQASSLNIGDVFKFEWPKYHTGHVVMRVHKMAFGDGKNNRVKITATEDVFAIPASTIIVEEESGWVEPGGAALVPIFQVAAEATYYEIVQIYSQDSTDNKLDSNPFAGYIVVAAVRPANGLNASFYIDTGSGYEDSGVVEFAPYAVIDNALDYLDDTINYTTGSDLDLIAIGEHAYLNGEIVRIDAIDEDLKTITIGRGCLDTVPVKHAAGSYLVCWDVYSATDEVEYLDGDDLDVKVLTNSSQGQLPIADGALSEVTMSSRAVRPYPPGDVEFNASHYPNYIDGALTVSWAHRDRLQQTTDAILDFLAGSVGPELGTTYTLRFYGEDGSLGRTETGLTNSGYTYNEADEKADFELPDSVPSDDAYIALVLADSPVAYYILDETSGTDCLDYSGNGYNAEYQGTFTLNQGDIVTGSPSVTFDGSSGRVVGPKLPDPEFPATLEGWFVVLDNSTPSGVLSSHNTNDVASGFQMFLSSGGVLQAKFGDETGGSSSDRKNFVSAGGDYTTGEVLHVVIRFNNASDVDMFINDTEVAVDSVSGSASSVAGDTSDALFTIAVDRAYTPDRFQNVRAAHCAYYNYALTDTQISGHYTAGTTSSFTYRLNGKLRIELEAVRDGYTSYQKHDHTIYRTGYGFNYGLNYGSTPTP